MRLIYVLLSAAVAFAQVDVHTQRTDNLRSGLNLPETALNRQSAHANFGTFPKTEGDSHLGQAQNPPPDDPNHRHEAWTSRGTDQVHRVQYSEADIPTYFALAQQYTLCDHYFSEVAGKDAVARMYEKF